MLTLLAVQYIAGGVAALLVAVVLALWKRLALSGMIVAVCALAIVVPSFLLSAGILRLINLFAQIGPETISDAEHVLQGLLRVMNLMQLGLIGTVLLLMLVVVQLYRRRSEMDPSSAQEGELPQILFKTLIPFGFFGAVVFEFGNMGIQKIIWAMVSEDIHVHPPRLAALHSGLADREMEAFSYEISFHILGALGGSLLACGMLLLIAGCAASVGRIAAEKSALAETLLAKGGRRGRIGMRASLALVAVLGLGAGFELARVEQQKSWVHLSRGQRYEPVERIWSYQKLPALPEEARKAEVFGPVSVQITVELDGTISQVRIVKGHELLDQAAIDAISEWRFSEELLAGLKEPQQLTMEVDFERE